MIIFYLFDEFLYLTNTIITKPTVNNGKIIYVVTPKKIM